MSKNLSIHKKLKTKLFKNFVRLLNNNEVPFWLDFDTLLGVWSSNKGRDLSFEQDIYVSIDQKHLKSLQNILLKIGVLYRVHSFTNRSPREWIPGSIITLGVFNRWKKRDFSFKIFISVKYKQNDEYRWVDNRNCKHINSKYFEKLDELEFDGIKYKIPSQTDKYLNYRYENWQAIPENWMPQINDKAIAEDRLISTFPARELKKRTTKVKIKLQDGNYMPRMKKMLLITIDLLQKNNIPFWLEAGTLLGIYRDGDLIPWDHDADLSIPAEYSDKVLALKFKFLPQYYMTKKKMQPIHKSWMPGDNTRVFKIKSLWAKRQNLNFHVDLFCMSKVEDKYHWIGSSVLKHADAKFFDNLDEITWEGRKIPVPSHTDEYLTLCYGNWRVPDKHYNSELQDGAIAEGGF
ncbi:MAG: LicD family protein [Bacteroidota bacterium]|nr:LicD family protein [Bacteroidota bacterium]